MCETRALGSNHFPKTHSLASKTLVSRILGGMEHIPLRWKPSSQVYLENKNMKSFMLLPGAVSSVTHSPEHPVKYPAYSEHFLLSRHDVINGGYLSCKSLCHQWRPAWCQVRTDFLFKPHISLGG